MLRKNNRYSISIKNESSSQSLEFCYAVTQASYANSAKEANQILQASCPDAKVVAEQSFNGWRVILVQKGDELTASFQGTHFWHHWIGNLLHQFFGTWPGTRQNIEAWIEEKQNSLGLRLTLITGHSAGAGYGGAIFKTSAVARVFFNPHHISDTSNTKYLCTANDPLTMFYLLLQSNPKEAIKNLFVVGSGGHKLDDFAPHIEGKNWNDLPPQDIHAPFTWKIPLSNKLDLRTEKELDPLVEDVEAKIKMAEKVAGSQAFISQSWKATENLVSAMQTLQEMRREEQKEFVKRQAQSDYFRETNEKFQNECTINEFNTADIYRHIQPGHFISKAQEVKVVTQEYKQALADVRKTLDQSDRFDLKLLQMKSEFSHLNETQQAVFNKLIAKHEELNSKYKTIHQVLEVAKWVWSIANMSPTPEVSATPVGRAGTAVLQTVQSSISYAHKKKADKLQRQMERSSEKLKKTIAQQERVAHAMAENQATRNVAFETFNTFMQEICQNPYALSCKQVEKEFNESKEVYQTASSKAAKTTTDLKEQCRSISSEIAQNKITIKRNSHFLKIKIGDKKKQEKENKKLLDKNRTLEANLAHLTNQLDKAQKAAESIEDEFKKVENGHSNWELRKPLHSQYEWLSNLESRFICAPDEKSQALRLAINQNLQPYLSMRSGRMQQITQLNQQLAQLGSYLGIKDEGFQALQCGYQTAEEIFLLRNALIPTWKQALAEYSGSIIDTIKNQPQLALTLGLSFLGATVSGIGAIYFIHRLCQGAQPSFGHREVVQLLQESMQQIATRLDESMDHKLLKLSDEIRNAFKKEISQVKDMIAFSSSETIKVIIQCAEENKERDANQFYEITRRAQNQFVQSLCDIINQSKKEVYATNNLLSVRERLENYFNGVCDALAETRDKKNCRLTLEELKPLAFSPRCKEDITLFTNLLSVYFEKRKDDVCWEGLFCVGHVFLKNVLDLVKNDEIRELIRNDVKVRKSAQEVMSCFEKLFQDALAIQSETSSLIIQLMRRKKSLVEQFSVRNKSAIRSAVLPSEKSDLIKKFTGKNVFSVSNCFVENCQDRELSLNELICNYYENEVQSNKEVATFRGDLLRLALKMGGFVKRYFIRQELDNFTSNKSWPSGRVIISSVHNRGVQSIQTYFLRASKDNDQIPYKIQWDKKCEVEHIQIARLELDDYSHIAKIQFTPNRIAKYWIRNTGKLSDEEYESLVHTLMQSYQDILNQKTLNPEDPLSKIYKNGTLICEKHGNVPLMIPNSIVETTDFLMKYYAQDLSAFGVGCLDRFYSVSEETGELFIEYHLGDPAKTKQNSAPVGLEFFKFRIAQFDPKVLEVFREISKLKIAEFLIVALYGRFVHPELTMPGRWVLNADQTELVHEDQIPIQDKYPQWWDFENKQNELTLLQSGDIVAIQGDDFSKIDQQIRMSRATVSMDKEYSKNYYLLKSLVNLFSNISDQEFVKTIEDYFDLPLPENLGRLKLENQSSEVDKDALLRFEREMLKNPSNHIWIMQHYRKQLSAFSAWMVGDVAELPKLEELNLSMHIPEQNSEKHHPKLSESSQRAAEGFTSRLEYKEPTAGFDNACALHALFGKWNSDRSAYYTEDARRDYTERFRSYFYGDYKKLIQDDLVNLLKDYLSGNGDAYIQYVLDPLRDEVEVLKKKIESESDPAILEGIYRMFFENPSVIDRYLYCCQTERYRFSDCELSIAANLFHKNVTLLTVVPNSADLGRMTMGPANGEPVYIFFENEHYNRLEFNKS